MEANVELGSTLISGEIVYPTDGREESAKVSYRRKDFCGSMKDNGRTCRRHDTRSNGILLEWLYAVL